MVKKKILGLMMSVQGKSPTQFGRLSKWGVDVKVFLSRDEWTNP